MVQTQMSDYQVLLFYKYIHFADPQQVRDFLHTLCTNYNLLGRGIIAHEGINITLEGTTKNTEAFIIELQKDMRFDAIHFKRSVGTGNAFRKLSMKVRSELVSAHLGTCDIDPNEVTGKRCSPELLHTWFAENKEFYVIDMRNVYEHAVGHFAGSILPPLDNFRDLPKIIKGIKHLKDKTVLTVCTGGVRCEKASGYLLTQGFTDVWQLDGGIVSYMEQYPNEHFQGKLYVFDNRVMMGFYTDDPQHAVIGTCEGCDEKSEHFINCSYAWCGRHFILCESCGASQHASKGAKTCPSGCKMRHPNKIASRRGRLWGRIQLYFTGL